MKPKMIEGAQAFGRFRSALTGYTDWIVGTSAMILWTSLTFAVLAGLIQPFSKRLHATGLWAGKALVPEEAAHAYPQGLQDALTDGWPSSLGLIGGALPFAAAVVGFFHAWWAGIAAFAASIVVSVIAERTPIASPYVERYLTILVDHLNNRRANYKKAGDSERESAAAELLERLTDLQMIYVGTQALAPDVKEAKAAPFGDHTFLLRK